jgi:hypothetical protein
VLEGQYSGRAGTNKNGSGRKDIGHDRKKLIPERSEGCTKTFETIMQC